MMMGRGSLIGWSRATALVLGAALIATTAHAYILPSDAVLEDVAKRRSEMKFSTMVLEGVRDRHDGSEPAKVWLAIWPKFGYRMEVRTADRTAVTLVLGKSRWDFDSGARGGAPTRVRGDLIIDFLANTSKDRRGKRGVEFLKRMKIDPEVMSLSRLDKRVAYVIGAKANEPDRPQLWIDKDLRVPCRLVHDDRSANARLDVQLHDFSSPITGGWYPGQIETRKDGALVETVRFTSLSLNEKLDSALFESPQR